MLQFNGHTVGDTGFGLMTLTSVEDDRQPDEKLFPVIKAAVESGATLWNTSDAYGKPDPLANLELIDRYFTQYPEDAKKVYVTSKGGFANGGKDWIPDHSPQVLESSAANMARLLGKHVDFAYIIGRVDPQIPIEETAAVMKRLIDEGKIKRWGLSECSAETIEKCHKIAPVSAVEIEFSVWSQEAVHNGVMAKCVEYGIPVIAYSPLGRGYLTGTVKSEADTNSLNRMFGLERLQQENLDKNRAIVDKLASLAAKYNATAGQAALD